MKVTALAPWYGAKRSMAAEIVAALGKHRAYWEPFCGSMAVLLGKPVSSHETVNDLHGDITNLAWVLQSDEWTKLYDRCARSIVCEGLLAAATKRLKEPCPELPDWDRAYWFFIKSWWIRNGVTGTDRAGDGLAVRFTSGGGHGGIRFRSATESMADWHDRLRSVIVLRRDAFAVIEAISDQHGTALYVDPPYLAKGAKYAHDLEPEDHRRLAELLRRFVRARVVVSYYHHPLLAELYPGWRQIDCTRTKALVSQGQRDGKNKAVAPEVLLVNDRDGGLFS